MTKARVWLLMLLTISMVALCPAADTVFRRAQMFSLTENHDTKVTLTLSDNDMAIQSQKVGGIRQVIPYAAIIRMRYESVSHHRFTQGFKTAALSPGVGAIVASTKGQDHWLAVDFNQGATQSTSILRLDKKEYQDVTSALTAKTGKAVELLDKNESLDPAINSLDVDDTMAFAIEKVADAVKHSMNQVGCYVRKESPSSIQCRRNHGHSDLTGSGGEIVTATLTPQGAATQLRIVTKKIAVLNRNWSTPIYEDVKHQLESAP